MMATSFNIGTAADQFFIAQGYFSDILNAQLVIFSLIVGAIVALNFLFSYKVSNNQIKTKIDELGEKLKKELQDEVDQKNKIISDNIDITLARHENMFSTLRGEVYRAFGQFWDSEKNYAAAFIWWMRAVSNLSIANEEALTRIALNSARESVSKVEFPTTLTDEIIGEYQTHFNTIDNTLFRIEKERLDAELKEVLGKKFEYKIPPTTQ